VSFVPANIFDPTAPEGEFLSLQFGADNSWQSSVTVRQPLFDPGAVVGLGAAERFRRLQTEVVRGRTQTVVTRVRQLCYDLQLRFEEVRLIERSLARVRQALEETRSRSGVGLASEYDVLRLEVELANLEPGLLRAANGLASARRQLGVELNLEEPSRLRLTTVDERRPSGSPQSLASQIEALETRALAQRSDVRQLEQMATLRQAQLRREQVEYLPRVSLFGSWDVQAQQNGSPDFFGTKNSRATSKIAGVAVELPLFTGLQRDARIDQRRVVMQQAETQAQLARSRASAEVRDLVAALTEAASREQAQGLAVSQAQRGFDIAMARLREGLGSQLEVTDAEVALRQSEFNLAQATHDRRVTRAHLDLSIGSVPHVDTHVGTDAEETE
jgi:outer membrane protein TolC